MSMSFEAETPEPPIRSVEEARAFLSGFETSLAQLMDVVEEETALVRDGRLYAATDLGARKSELLGDYLRRRTRLKSEFSTIARLLPDALPPLRERHQSDVERVRANLAALAIAREVAEGIVRSVATDVGRRAAPRTYGRNAGLPSARTAAARGIAIDRRL